MAISIEANNDIETGTIEAFSSGSGDGGNIDISGENIVAKSLRADSVGNEGGKIRLSADRFIRITGSTSINGIEYSIFNDSKDVAPLWSLY